MSTNRPTIDFFHKLADIAEKKILEGYLKPKLIDIDCKPKDGFRFDPVTNIDRDTELLLRSLIMEYFPDHSILGEEFGKNDKDSSYRWVIDPIDGTRPFICGIPVWGSLIALELDNVAIMGMMSQPFTQERFWADGKQSWTSNFFGSNQLITSDTILLEKAILHTTSPELYPLNPQVNFNELTDRVLMTRYGGECYAMAMLAAGKIDICLELALQPYDIAALIPIIEQAGGVVTTLQGKRAEAGGQILASANGILHEAALKILNN